MAVIENFIRNTDNQIKLQLLEDGDPIAGAWTKINIHFGGVDIERTASGDGVELSETTGILIITPGDLLSPEITAIDALSTNRHHPVEILITSILNDDGVVFGGKGAEPIYFKLSDKPA